MHCHFFVSLYPSCNCYGTVIYQCPENIIKGLYHFLQGPRQFRSTAEQTSPSTTPVYFPSYSHTGLALASPSQLSSMSGSPYCLDWSSQHSYIVHSLSSFRFLPKCCLNWKTSFPLQICEQVSSSHIYYLYWECFISTALITIWLTLHMLLYFTNIYSPSQPPLCCVHHETKDFDSSL